MRLKCWTMAGRVHPVAWQGEVLTDRTEAREKCLRASRVAKSLQMTLAPTRGLMAVLRTVVHTGTALHEYVLHADQFGDLCLCRRVAAQLVVAK
jgi:hypothetical protein